MNRRLTMFVGVILLACAAAFWAISGCGGGGGGGGGSAASPSTPAELPISIEGIDNKTGIDVESNFEFSFLEAIDPDTVTADTFYLSVGSNCDATTRVAASISVSADNKTITLDPDESLEYSTTYAICLTSEILYADGTATAGLSFSFTTAAVNELPSPQVSSTSPLSNKTGVSVSTTVQAVFDMAMDSSTITTSTFTLSTGGSAVSGAVSYDSSSNTATFAPSTSLSYLTAYTATLSSSIASADGETLGSDYSWTFTTIAETPSGPSYSATPSMGVGLQHACALIANGTVKCWGSNQYGQLGRGTVNDPTESTTAVTVLNQNGTTLTDVVELAVANSTNFVRLSDGSVKGWGYNGAYHSVGAGGSTDFRNDTDYAYPVSVVNAGTNLAINGVTAISAESGNACLIFQGGVKCWGENSWGQVGKGSLDSWPNRVTKATDVVELGQGSGVQQIDVGINAACAILLDNTVQCWGWNTFGSLGRGGSTAYCGTASSPDCSKSTPAYVLTGTDPDTNLSGIEEIFYDSQAGCGRRSSDGKYFCWGRNDSYMTLMPALQSYGVATENTSLFGMSDMTFGIGWSCGILSENALCWGKNAANVGNLGIGSMVGTTYSAAQDVLVTTTASSIDGRVTDDQTPFFCAVLTNDTVECWGGNASGQLGDGTTTANATPVTVQDSDTGTDMDLTP